MVGFKRKLPMSEALRPGGAGMKAPPKTAPALDIGALKGPKVPKLPTGPTTLGEGLPDAMVKPPKGTGLPRMAKGGRLPSLPKLPSFKLPKIK
jgi:hypothetical protein